MKQPKTPRLWPLGLLVPLGIIYYFCKFVLPGYSFTALVCLCLAAVILFYTAMPFLSQSFPGLAKVLTVGVTAVLVLGFCVCAVTEALIIKSSFGDPQEQVDYVVVLGAKVRDDGPSVSLWDRIYAARDYLEAHPHTVAVLSGGKGKDEPISEAQCMFTELLALGIEPGRLWQEDKAESTWENICFSLDLIQKETGTRPQKIGVLSSEYHLFRASLFAKKNQVEFVGIPARTSHLSQRINHFMREVAGVWHYIILGGNYSD